MREQDRTLECEHSIYGFHKQVNLGERTWNDDLHAMSYSFGIAIVVLVILQKSFVHGWNVVLAAIAATMRLDPTNLWHFDAIVDCCTRYAAQVIGIAALLGLATAIYAAGHFAIDADVYKLISKELPWRQREVAFEKSFPRKEETILAIIDAPTSELATQATTALIEKLAGQKDLFRFILEAGGGPFFRKNGLLHWPEHGIAGRRSLGGPRSGRSPAP